MSMQHPPRNPAEYASFFQYNAYGETCVVYDHRNGDAWIESDTFDERWTWQ